MKRLFSITLVMFLSSTMFFTVVYAGEHEGVIPVKGTWSGITSFLGQGNCPSGSIMIQSIGKGVMTLTAASEWVGAPACLDQATGFASGTAVIIVANGDALYLTSGIQFTFDSATSGSWVQDTIGYGGTGRFAGTGGTSHSWGEFHFINQTEAVWTGTNEGDITF